MRKRFSQLFFTFMIAVLSLIIVVCSKGMEAVNTNSSTATIYVEPQTSWGNVGQNFTVNICISNVADLYGWEFKMGWNSTILDAVDVSEEPFLKSGGSTFFMHKINNTLGYMIVDCTLLGNVPGVSGGGTLAAIKFYVETVGECPLDLYDTILVNSAEQSIEHTAVDGYYYTSVHDVAIIDITASSTEVNVTVENQGTRTETFNVSTYYTRLSDPLIGTQTVTLTKGAVAMLTFTWAPPYPWRYEIRAEASTVPGETDVADNVHTIIIQAGYGASSLRSQAASSSSLNGFYIAVGAFISGLVMMTPRILRYKDRTQNYVFPNIVKSEPYVSDNSWQALIMKQSLSLR
jgi:hypothetical protein